MNVLANAVGLVGVMLFVFSYQLKSRISIILCNAVSRLLYVAQYLMLGAFEGALLDVIAFLISFLCCTRNNGFMKKHPVPMVILSNVLIVGVGLFTYEDIFSIFPIVGVVFETSALWLQQERNIRIVSLLGAPFWLVYNLINMAYGSCVGNVITLISISVAILRYDILGNKQIGASRE